MLTAPEYGLRCPCGALLDADEPCGEQWDGMLNDDAIVTLTCLSCGDSAL